MALVPETCNIVVQVNRAFNIPLPRAPPPASTQKKAAEPEYEDTWKDEEVLKFIINEKCVFTN